LARRLAARLEARRADWPILAIVLCAGVAYFFALGKSSLWYDETYSAAFAALSWQHLIDVMVHADGQGLPYYAFLHVWTAFGANEAVLRAPSVLAALVALIATYALGNRLFDRGTAVIGTALLAVNPLFIYLAREARSYTFAIAFVTVSSLVFMAATSGPNRPRLWIVYAAAGIAACYGHLLAVLVLAAHAVYAFIVRRRERARGFILALGAVAVAVSPVVWIAVRGDMRHLDWIPPTTFAGTIYLATVFTGSLPLIGVDCALLALAALEARRAPADGDRFLWCWLLVPTAAVTAFSFVHPLLVERYLAIVMPAFCLLLARGVRALRWVPGQTIAAVLLVALTASSARSDYLPLEDWRGAVASIVADARAGDALVVFPADRVVPVMYYLRPHAAAGPRLVYPAGRDLDFNALSARYPRLWLIVHMPEDEDDPELDDTVRGVEALAERSYALVERKRFRRVTVLLWSTRR
jgi:mannosyltransferase